MLVGEALTTPLNERVRDESYSIDIFIHRVLNGYGRMPPRRDACENHLREIYADLGGYVAPPYVPLPGPPSVLPPAPLPNPSGEPQSARRDCTAEPRHPECQRRVWQEILRETQRKVAERRAAEEAKRAAAESLSRWQQEQERKSAEQRNAALGTLGVELRRHSYFLALETSRCKSSEEIRADRISSFASPITRTCRMGNVRDVTITRKTLAEVLDPSDRPADRDPDRRGGGFGRGTIEEPGYASGYVEVSVDGERCIVPERSQGNAIVRWTCANFGGGTVRCPPDTDFVKISRDRTEIMFRCMKGTWTTYEQDLRRVARSGNLGR